MSVKIDTAMVLAAGLGMRMRPLTLDRPKALVEVGGKTLIDHMLDRLEAAGIRRAVVNVHAFADKLEAHLAKRSGAMQIVISDERDMLRETGGGIKHARSLLGDGPIVVTNIDSVWIEHGAPAISSLINAFDPARMDALLMLTRTETAMGFDGPGDAFMGADKALTFRLQAPGAATAPYAYIGVHVTKLDAISAWPQAAFSLVPLWLEKAKAGRIRGHVLDGQWMHVGDPAARDEAEALLAEQATT